MDSSNFVLKDSGSREEFETGSRRDIRSGKGRYDLMSPFVLDRDARLLELGAAKYGERNWEKGQPISRFIDSAMRHLLRYVQGHRDEDHLAAARWNIGAIMHMEEMTVRGIVPMGLFDLPDWSGVSAEDPAQDCTRHGNTPMKSMKGKKGMKHEMTESKKERKAEYGPKPKMKSGKKK